MYLPITPAQTCAAAWLEAANAVNAAPGHEAHNVIIDVAEPLSESAPDRRVIQLVDGFLRSKEKTMPTQAVANTIFPQDLYRRHGAPKLYDVYENVYEHIKKQGDWGRYFERMIRRTTSGGEVINPLGDMVAKMKKHVHGDGNTFRNIYELTISDPTLDIPIYDPERDAGPVMNRQCMSFLSFKLDHDNRLMLTAVYRNHYYVRRLLGNLIGLTRLMAFVGNEAGVPVGPLTVVSTHAEIDVPKGARRSDVNQLLSECGVAYETSEVA
jgi:thymidylate synthase